MGLYPTINLPRLIRPLSQRRQNGQGLQPSFDFMSGDFLFAGGKAILINGQEAFEQWCLKVCMTERNTRLAYTDKIGTEFKQVGRMNDREAIKSHIIRTLTEAILIHPSARAVKDFTFTLGADSVVVGFEVQSDFGLSRLEVEL